MERMYDKWEAQGQDIDLDLWCICGTSFRMYLPFSVYECPDCHRLYEATVIVNILDKEDNKENYTLIGNKNEN